ncbi:MAG: chorismate-binding protein, partial [Actinomycetota bacterium]|nr:chorismate-binding protein [Actinomycetota bacterium]
MIAVTRDLAGTPFEHVSLVDIAGDDGLLFRSATSGRVGIGCAAVVDVDRAVEELHKIELRNDSSADDALLPLALGCVDFLPGAPATLTVPELTIVDNGSGYRYAVVCAAEHDVDRIFGSLTVKPPPPPSANSFHVTSPIAISTYLEAVTEARDAVRSGKLRKAVIARPVIVTADHAMSIHAVLRRLDATFRSTYRFSIHGFVGASPELLV